MCDVVTALAIASTAAGAVQQTQQASNQNRVARQNARAATVAARQQAEQNARRIREQRLAQAQRGLNESRRFRRARATAETSAAENGVRGTSVDALLSQIDRQGAEALNTQELNATGLNAAGVDTAQNIFTQQLNSVNQANAALSSGVDPLALGLSIGGNVADGFAAQRQEQRAQTLFELQQNISNGGSPQ